MSELNVYYHVVPTNDGCVYLCRNKNTSELYLWDKAFDKNSEALVFSSEQAADEWIELMRLPRHKFKSEWFATIDIIEDFSDIVGLDALGYNFDVGM